MSDSRSVVVTLLDKEYRVACPPGERDNLVRAAHLLDDKLNKVRDAGINGLERIAIMAALNLSHELLQTKEQGGGSSVELEYLLNQINSELRAGEEM